MELNIPSNLHASNVHISKQPAMVKLPFRLLSLFLVVLAATLASAISQTAAGTDITGDQYCSPYACFHITLDNAKHTATISVNTSETTGWIGIGFGSQMVGPELNVMWMSHVNQGVIISRRKATAHALPPALANQTAVTLLQPSGTTNGTGNPYLQNNQLVYSYIRPQVLPESTLNTSSTKFVWAYGLKRPTSDECHSAISKHQAVGSFTLDLTKSITNNTAHGNTTSTGTASSTVVRTATASSSSSGVTPTASSTAFSTTPPISLMTQYYMKISHAVIMFCAWGILIPLASFIARFGKKMDHWVRQHWIIQVIAVLLTIVGFIIGVILSEPNPPTYAHQILGIAIFIAVLFQFLLGWFIHYRYNRERDERDRAKQARNQQDPQQDPSHQQDPYQQNPHQQNPYQRDPYPYQQDPYQQKQQDLAHNSNQAEVDNTGRPINNGNQHDNQHDNQRDEPDRRRRPARNYMHMFFGITLLLLGFVQIPLGMALFSLSSGWFYAYYVWLAVQVIVFLILTVRQIAEQRREENSNDQLTRNPDEFSEGSSQPSMRSPEPAYNPNNRF
ncbi:hypothetical protein BC937DRAFT_87707 [Endogone sp. FLAS-F59071]|nr:hypothetical protein BC937DRAFT_87707 [Endogone sp. FLAS-F59071]|eukprot:RUS19299.1 hypothetical protein BC937DRAFT_87707 [Endogone sp. FLAS-F59071]